MKLNKSGFTLVELLASVVILAIMIGVAVPNITEVMKKQKNHVYVEDGKRFASQARTIMNKDTSIRKEAGTCFSLNFLDNGDFDEAPNGGRYLKDVSYIRYGGKDASNNDIYVMTLVECVNCEKNKKYDNYANLDVRGLSKVNYNTLVNTDNYNSLIKTGNQVNTLGMENDSACIRGYINPDASYEMIGKGAVSEYTFNYMNCGYTNRKGNKFTFYENQTWEEYLDVDNNELYADVVNNGGYYVVKRYFEPIEKREILFRGYDDDLIKLFQNCDRNGENCTITNPKLTDKIVPSSQGYYEYGYYSCPE